MSGKAKPQTTPNPTETTTAPPADEATTTQGSETTQEDDAEDEEGEEEDEGEQDPPKITLTSKQMTERLKRAQGKQQKEMLKELGFDNLDDAKAALKKLKDAEDEKLSETEKLRKENEDLKKKAETAAKTAERLKRDKEEQQAKDFLNQQIKKAGVTDDAAELTQSRLEKYIEDNFEDDEDVTEEMLKPFFKQLKKDKKLWFEPVDVPASTHKPDKGPQNPAPTTPQRKSYTAAEIDAMSPAEWARAKREMGYQ